MKEQFVTYEITLALKELGFDEYCFALYNTEDDIDFVSFCTTKNSTLNEEYLLAAPLWQQVIDWLYTEYRVIIYYGTDDWSLVTPKESFLYNELLNSTVYEKWKQAILKAIELCQKEK